MPEYTLTDQQPGPLLEPKFHPPRLQTRLVERGRLLTMLDEVLERKVTLLCAPAGSGKTTLLGQWMARRGVGEDALPVAWLALEKSDNDPLRFWRYVMTACRVFQPEVGEAALAQISAALSALTLPPLETPLTLLLNDLTRVPAGGVLVLEDYHLIVEPYIHQTLQFFLDHLPAQIHVVLLARGEPPLALARWRARGELCEISAAELRFSRDEMEGFLHPVLARTSTALSPEIMERLAERLEGWAAGLRLLALALQSAQGAADVAQVLKTFAGEQRSLQEYFVSEVLDVQSALWQDFLLRTSLFTRLTGPLCDVLVRRTGSAALLEEIARTGLFLEALERSGGWYRYHALFAEAMQAEARRRLGETALRELALRASQWYEQQGMFAEAIETAFQAREMERAASLIEHLLDNVKHFLLSPQVFQEVYGFHTLHRWLETLPQTIMRERPLLSLGHAVALLLVVVVDQPRQKQVSPRADGVPAFPLVSYFEKIEQALQMAEQGFRAAGDLRYLGGALAIRALIAREQGDLVRAMAHAEEAMTCLPEEEQEWQNLVLNVIGTVKLVNGELEEARVLLLEQCARSARLNNRAILRANGALLNLVYYEQGKLRQTATFFAHMLDEARAENDIDDIAHASLLLGLHAYEWNNLQEAEQRARECLELGGQLGNEEFQVLASLLLARIEHVRGETAQAQERCTALLARLPVISPLRQRLNREIQLVQARLALAQDDLAAVEKWSACSPPMPQLPLALRVNEELLRARWLCACDRGEQALATLAHLLDEARQAGRGRSALEIQAVLLLLRHSCGQVQEARQALQDLLAQAQTEGYLRLFLDEGETMLTLLRVSLAPLRERSLIAYAQHILRSAAGNQAEASATPATSAPAYTLLAEPLSPQEQRVLRLLIAGYSNPEIARDLVVSVNTVKVHLKHIYQKLKVSNRVEASEAARHLDFS
jgi:LuxR family maltose regulon positive regulatory protein